jgi:hypothetical protein
MSAILKKRVPATKRDTTNMGYSSRIRWRERFARDVLMRVKNVFLFIPLIVGMMAIGNAVWADGSLTIKPISATFAPEGSEQTFTLSNDGDVPLDIGTIEAVYEFGNGRTAPSESFFIGDDENGCSGKKLSSSSEECQFLTKFKPQLSDEKKATVFVLYDEFGSSNTLRVPLQSNESRSSGLKISVKPMPHDFGEVYVEFSDYQMFKVSNVGTVPFKIGKITIPEITTPAMGNGFSIRHDICSGQKLTSAKSCFVVIEFKPPSIGEKSANLLVPYGTKTPVYVPLKGSGVDWCPKEPEIKVKPDPIDFGGVSIGDSMSMPVSVRMKAKNCKLQLKVDDITVIGPDADKFRVIKPLWCKSGIHKNTSHSFCRFKLVFNAGQPVGTEDAELEIAFNDSTTKIVPIKAKAVVELPVELLNPKDVEAVYFGKVVIGMSSKPPLPNGLPPPPDEFFAINISRVNVSITSYGFSGHDADSFQIVEGPEKGCHRGIVLQPGDMCYIHWRFSPKKPPGRRKTTGFTISADRNLHYNYTFSSNGLVSLYGDAIMAPCPPASITTKGDGSWTSPSTWKRLVSSQFPAIPGPNDVVRIEKDHTVTAPLSTIKVKALCIDEDGTLVSNDEIGTPLSVDATDLIENKGTIRGKDGCEGVSIGRKGIRGTGELPTPIKIKDCRKPHPGADVNLTVGKVCSGLEIERPVSPLRNRSPRKLESHVSPRLGRRCHYSGDFNNEGKIIAGKGATTGEDGGAIYIKAGNIIVKGGNAEYSECQHYDGAICAGKGGNASFYGHKAAGNGKSIFMVATESISTDRAYIAAGDGGDCYGSYKKGGYGGGVALTAPDERVIDTKIITGKRGNGCGSNYDFNKMRGKIFIDPSNVLISGEDTVIEGSDVTIAGGDNGTIELSGLKEGAITATGDLTLAVGEDSVIMSDSTDNILKADGQVNLLADDILLGDDVNVSDITGDNVVIGSGQIVRDVSLMASGNSSGEPGITLPFEVTLSNNGPETDTYLLTITDEEGWSLSQLPSSLEIEGGSTTELTLDVVLPSTREATNVITVTAISQTDPMVITTTEINVMVTEKIPDSVVVDVSINRCPSSGIINRLCKNHTQVLTDVTLDVNANVSGGTFAGQVQNKGIISQATVQTGAVITGGKYTGYITNEGTLTDFEFVGAEIKGGELAGNVRNNSQVGGVFINVSLAANTEITGGYVEGDIDGKANAPAVLRNVSVKSGSRLSNVILGEGVQLPEDVVFGEGIRFTDLSNIPSGVELMELLPTLSVDKPEGVTYPRRADFTDDILIPSDGILSIINELPMFKDNGWVFSQNKELGYFEITIDNVRYAEIPFSVRKTTDGADMVVLDAQSLSFVTSSGLDVLTNPALQAPTELQLALSKLGLPEAFTIQPNGNLRIGTDSLWYSARPDWLSIELANADVTETGVIHFIESPYGGSLVSLTFDSGEASAREQLLYPAVAYPEVLYSSARNISIEPYGLVNFTLNGKAYRGVVDYLVTQTDTTTDTLQVESIADVNGDGIDDIMLTYATGEQQMMVVVK